MPTLTRQYLLAKDESSQFIILALALFLIIGFWTIILFQTVKNPGDVVAYEKCPVGECATRTVTGEKRCPLTSSLQMEYDPILEVCNPVDSCTSSTTPYSVQLDSSTSISGQCGVNNDSCRCVNYLATPSYIESIFNMQNGSFYSADPNSQSRVILVQQMNKYVGEGNNIPIVYDNPSTQFWEIAPDILNYLWPNPCSDIFGENPEPDAQKILACVNRNPCLAGKMAYIPNSSAAFSNFSQSSLTGGVSLGCVPNSVYNSPDSFLYPNTCDSNDDNYYAPVFNPSNGQIFCYQTTVNKINI
jgi:hypothetical protein